MKNLLLNPPLEWIGIGLSIVMLATLLVAMFSKRNWLAGLLAVTGAVTLPGAFDLTRLEDANTPLNPFSHTFFPSPAAAYVAMVTSAIVLGIAGLYVMVKNLMVKKQLTLTWFLLTLSLATMLVSGGLGRAWKPLDAGWDALSAIFMVLTALMSVITIVSLVQARRRRPHLQVA